MIFVEKIANEKRNFLKEEEYKYRMENLNLREREQEVKI